MDVNSEIVDVLRQLRDTEASVIALRVRYHELCALRTREERASVGYQTDTHAHLAAEILKRNGPLRLKELVRKMNDSDPVSRLTSANVCTTIRRCHKIKKVAVGVYAFTEENHACLEQETR